MIKHYFNFITSGHGRKEIYEPIGFDVAEFEISQDEGRKGRDVTSAGANNEKLRIANIPEYHFDIFIYNKERFGSEAVIKYEIDFDDTVFVVGDVTDIVTDKSTYAEFTVIEENSRSLLKTRFDVKTNLFSFFTLDDASILPVQTANVLLKAKPIVSVSQWKNPTYPQTIESDNEFGEWFNVVKSLEQYDIKNSLSWLFDTNNDTGDSFRHIEAQTNLKDVTVRFNHNLTWNYKPKDVSGDKRGVLRLRVIWGQDIDDSILAGQYSDVFEHQFTGGSDQSITLPAEMSASIPFVNNTDIIWIH